MYHVLYCIFYCLCICYLFFLFQVVQKSVNIFLLSEKNTEQEEKQTRVYKVFVLVLLRSSVYDALKFAGTKSN